MNTTDSRRPPTPPIPPRPQMPRAPQPPTQGPAQQVRPRTLHDDGAEEDAHAAKRYHDQVKEIEMLND